PTIRDLAKYLKKELNKISSQTSSNSLISDRVQGTTYPISKSAVNPRETQALEPKTAAIEYQVQCSHENASFSAEILQEELKMTLAEALFMSR
ncbi:hypothetical protein CN582_29555, partial [Bacillus wiedmannii]|uniref:hypothetical protein n=1 Tax=Bacillus wiedmannii TaxID=1890302 RepID=UPI000BFAC3D5